MTYTYMESRITEIVTIDQEELKRMNSNRRKAKGRLKIKSISSLPSLLPTGTATSAPCRGRCGGVSR